jgi:polar amino acid transport system substrate-binding protein
MSNVSTSMTEPRMQANLPSLPATAGPGSLRILVADDNEMLRGAVQSLFRLLGYSVDAVANGREAVEAAARQEYALVLLDIQMPEMNGFEAARSIRGDCPSGDRTRIVGLSAEGEETASFGAAGMDDYLRKPVLFADLVRILNRLPRLDRTSTTTEAMKPTRSILSHRSGKG